MFGMMAASTEADVGERLGLSPGWEESRGNNVCLVVLAGAGGARGGGRSLIFSGSGAGSRCGHTRCEAAPNSWAHPSAP